MTNFAVAFIFLSIVLLFVFSLFSILNYKNRFKMKYDFRNHYIYELNYEGKFSDNLIGNIAIVALAASGIAFYTLFNNNFNNDFLLFTLIAGSLYSFTLTGLAFISLNKHLKLHLVIVLFAVVLGFLIPFSNAMASSISYKDSQNVISLVMAIVNAVYCLFIFVLMMNPRLSRWAELKEEKNNDGTVKYVRPKVFILAFIEWALIISSPVIMILTVLTSLFGI